MQQRWVRSSLFRTRAPARPGLGPHPSPGGNQRRQRDSRAPATRENNGGLLSWRSGLALRGQHDCPALLRVSTRGPLLSPRGKDTDRQRGRPRGPRTSPCVLISSHSPFSQASPPTFHDPHTLGSQAALGGVTENQQTREQPTKDGRLRSAGMAVVPDVARIRF